MKKPLALVAVAGTAYAASRRRTPVATDAPLPVVHGVRREVVATDGVVLAAEVHGPEDAVGTLVLAHGYVLSQRLWARQVAAVTAARPDLRVVTYDQRGHGRSGRTTAEHATLEQLGLDLRSVLDALATGPAVVAGHSMGGMTVMSLVEQFPELVGDRVVGAGLVATSPGRLADVTWGLPAAAAARVQAALPRAMELGKKREAAGAKPAPMGWMRPLLFGRGARPSDVRATVEALTATPSQTVADLHLTFTRHDRVAALAALAEVPTLVLCGTEDRICPLDHTQDIAAALPSAQLYVYPGAGHMLQLERDAEVSARLVELCAVIEPRPATAPRRAARRAG